MKKRTLLTILLALLCSMALMAQAAGEETTAKESITLYCYDKNANDISISNVLRQCLQLIALFPVLSVYSYQAYNYYHDNQSLFIHSPQPNLSTAENFLHMLRPDSSYTMLEAKLLDMFQESPEYH